ncbi:Asp-tRNA(Asn)/Glu-tRNA(Gln) amidotransferase subunit GatA [Allofustis seminis]|uniref:Asp-tRNA(Asn)/Glu-tRNA(Gln) amidotransferase subunit GatA n=1 Tax=Allofustis seminis TaxID=166939 RepID=UPI000360C43C|nr:Asp-tRNA(Asn)/Glu-tRNA(Gln) amidotransferase subunit GatA [Allofustis seminis]
MFLNETIESLHRQLVSGETTATQLVNRAFDAIAETDPQLRAFLDLDPEGAREVAKKIDEEGIKDDELYKGIPIAIKDNIVTTQMKTTAASKMLENFVSIYDATVVHKLEDAGMIIIGKLNLDEFAMGGTTETSHAHTTANAWNIQHVPGGSSGGSAAAVASGMVPVALGTDTGGSIRQPAAYNGIVGMKPTYGTISRWGVIAFASSLDQVGPMTKTVKDNAQMLNILYGQDGHDNTLATIEAKDYTEKIGHPIAGMVIGVPKETMDATLVDKHIIDCTKHALKQLESQGAVIKEISLPLLKYGVPAYYTIATAEASSNLQRFDGIRYGFRAENAQDLEDVYVKTRTEGFGEEVKIRCLLGTYMLSAERYEDYFKHAARVRTLISQDFEKAFENVDVIVTPTTTTTAPKLKEYNTVEEEAVDRYSADLLTVPVNLAGIPALSLPCGFVNGLPVGLQLIGRSFDESTLYQVGYAFEQATDYHTQHPHMMKGEESR